MFRKEVKLVVELNINYVESVRVYFLGILIYKSKTLLVNNL